MLTRIKRNCRQDSDVTIKISNSGAIQHQLNFTPSHTLLVTKLKFGIRTHFYNLFHANLLIYNPYYVSVSGDDR